MHGLNLDIKWLNILQGSDSEQFVVFPQSKERHLARVKLGDIKRVHLPRRTILANKCEVFSEKQLHIIGCGRFACDDKFLG
jgi:hypothetical protein